MANIANMTVGSGRRIKEDDTIVNVADMIEAIYHALVVNKDAGVVLGGSAEIQVSAELEEGSLVGLVPGTEVALTAGAVVDLAEGVEVGLASGAEVDLVSGASVAIVGNTLTEQKTQADAVANVITFSQNINVIEIFHAEATWQNFIVNGLTLVIPSGGYRTPIAGVPGLTVTIPAAVNCIVGRLI